MHKALTYIRALTIIVLVAALLYPTAFADENVEQFFVMDKADVISSELEADIKEKGETILAQSGCRFAVAAVDFLGGKDIEQFCRDLYIENSMGNNGILLVFSVAEENYHIVQGEAVKDKLSDSELKEILDKYVEQPFEAGEYEKALKNAHGKIIEKLEGIYSITAEKELYEQQLKEIELANQNTAKTKKMYGILFILAVFIAFVFFIRMIVSFYYYSKRKRR